MMTFARLITGMRRAPALALVGVAGSLALAACGRDAARPPSGPPASVQLTVRPSQFEDDRVYSVGRVQLRAVDRDDRDLVAPDTVLVDRATGEIDAAFTVPAGAGLRALVEPLGSGILPGGDKTESGVALQGLSLPFDLEPDGMAAVEVALDPFIPDDLVVDSTAAGTFLSWRAMPTAESHEVRVFETPDPESVAPTTRVVPVRDGNRVNLLTLLRSGFVEVGFQVRSVNRFSTSAFSDTLFIAGFPAGGGGGGGGGGTPGLLDATSQSLYLPYFAYIESMQLVSAAVTYAFLAGEIGQGGDGPLLSGTLTLDPEKGFVYSQTPTDRLVVDDGSGTTLTFAFTAFTGPDVGSAGSFIDNHEDLDFQVVWSGIADARVRSSAAPIIGGFNRITRTIRMTGTLDLFGEGAVSDVTVTRVETDISSTEHQDRTTVAGTSNGGGVAHGIDVEWIHAATTGDVDVDVWHLAIASTFVLDDRTYAWSDAGVDWTRRDGLVSAPETWSATGSLLQGGTAQATIRFTAAPVESDANGPGILLDFGGGVVLQFPLLEL